MQSKRTKMSLGGALTLLSFLLFAGLHLWITESVIQQEFPNEDEIAHLPSGVSHWSFGSYTLYRVNPPLVRTVATAAQPWLENVFDWRLTGSDRPEFLIGKEALHRHGLGYQQNFDTPKRICAVFSVFGAFLFMRITRHAFGELPSVLAVGFWFVCPNFLAWGHSLCPDIGMTTMGLAVSYCCWKYVRSPGIYDALLIGIALGFALTTKLTWVTGMISFPLSICLSAALTSYRCKHTWVSLARDILVVWIAAIFVLNAGYQFDGTFDRLGDFRFKSKMLSGNDAQDSNPIRNRFSDSIVESVPVPVPRDFILGIDYLKSETEDKKWSFLDGHWRLGAWGYYYCFTIFYKTPETTLIAFLIGFSIFMLGCRRKLVCDDAILFAILLVVPASICFLAISTEGGFNHHHRYVLFVYPIIWYFASFLASPFAIRSISIANNGGRLCPVARETSSRDSGIHQCIAAIQTLIFWEVRRDSKSISILRHSVGKYWLATLAFTLLSLSMISSICMHPNYVSYFNWASGGPKFGWKHLAHSNVDWGHGLLQVNNWIQQHPECRPLVFELSYSNLNGEIFGLPPASPPDYGNNYPMEDVRRSVSQNQWWIISVKKLYNLPDSTGLEYLQQIEPIERIGYAYHVYKIDPLDLGPTAR